MPPLGWEWEKEMGEEEEEKGNRERSKGPNFALDLW